MKKLISTAFAVFVFVAVNAQNFEIKINPLGALFGRPELSGEYVASKYFGAELSLSANFGKFGPSVDYSVDGTTYTSEAPTQSGFGVKVAGKYYFAPKDKCDGWYVGLYLRNENIDYKYEEEFSAEDFESKIFAGGIEVGKKWVWETGVLIDLGFGIGRPISEKRTYTNAEGDYVDFDLDVDFTGKLAIGYRF